MRNPALENLNTKIAAGRVALATGIFFNDPLMTEQLSLMDFDLVWIDLEHTGHSVDALRGLLQAVDVAGKVSMVRVADTNPATIKPILELAPGAVIFPLINTKADAELAISSCRYPPAGIRGYGPLRAQKYWTVPMEEYIRDVEKCFWRVIQIETEEGVNNLDDILSVPGIDSVVVGPNDLSASAGLLGQYRHPKVLKMMDTIAEKCNSHHIPFGVALGYNEDNLND